MPAGTSRSTTALGFEFGTFTDRFERLEEALQIVSGMLRGDRPTLDGRWYAVRDAINSPAPVGRIPVMIGGAGERKTLRMAAQYADDSILICPIDDIPRKVRSSTRTARNSAGTGPSSP